MKYNKFYKDLEMTHLCKDGDRVAAIKPLLIPGPMVWGRIDDDSIWRWYSRDRNGNVTISLDKNVTPSLDQ